MGTKPEGAGVGSGMKGAMTEGLPFAGTSFLALRAETSSMKR